MQQSILKENTINFNYKELCSNCGLPNIICICSKIERISLKNKVSVIIPYIERHKSSNTGGLVKATLNNSEVFIRGEKNKLFTPEDVLLNEYQNLILYTGGKELTYDYIQSFNKPVNLIVPDGTWTTAPRIVMREPRFYSIPKVSLLNPPKSQYKLRKHPNPFYISTFEAIAYSLAIIENDSNISDKLMKSFLMKIDALLWLAGKLPVKDVRGGVSEKAIKWKNGD